MPSEGLPLGILPNPEYQDFSLQLKKGDSLLLYSDALIESPNKKGVRMGIDTFQKRATNFMMKQDLDAAMNDLLADFFTFAPPPPPDDVTAVLLKWEPK